VTPSSIHQAHLQSSNGLSVLADAATSLQSRVAVSEPVRLPVLPPNAISCSSSASNLHSANRPALSAEDLGPSHPKSLLPQKVCSTTHQRKTVCAHLKSPEPTRPNSQPTNEVIQDNDYFAFNDKDETLPTSAFQSSHTSVLSSDTVVITAVNRPYCTTSCKYRTTEKLQPYKAVLQPCVCSEKVRKPR
jgi:hypothetical protein